MILNILLCIVYLLLFGLVLIQGTYNKVGIGEKPLIYTSSIINGIMSLALLLWIGISIFLIFFSWKMLLILFAVGILFGKLVLVPVSEFLIIKPLFYVLTSNKR